MSRIKEEMINNIPWGESLEYEEIYTYRRERSRTTDFVFETRTVKTPEHTKTITLSRSKNFDETSEALE